MKLGVVSEAPTDAPTVADVAMRRALEAAVEARRKVKPGPNVEIEADVAAGRAAASHLMRAFNDEGLVSMLAGIAALHSRYHGPLGRWAEADPDVPF